VAQRVTGSELVLTLVFFGREWEQRKKQEEEKKKVK
jgi:hypothetical protein